MNHVSVDLETLATTPDAVILSIGAVKFNLETGKIDDDGFYASISVESNLELERRISDSTLTWWMGQPEGARAVFTETKIVLPAALEEFADWLDDKSGKIHIWGNGPEFDVAILAHAYAQIQMDTPWRFYNAESVRTYRNLPGADKVPRPAPQIAHHALHDALAQAQYVCDIHKALFKPAAPTAAKKVKK